MQTDKDRYTLDDLKQLMARLRAPIDGCPWDIEQTFETIKPHTIEEAYEVADAIERGTMDDLKDELGDLLFQVVFHAQMASENNDFSFDDVIDHVTKKMIFRHPHVFEQEKALTADDVKNDIWERQKEKERHKKGETNTHLLDSVTRTLPSLLLANKIQKKVRKVGFEYPSIDDVFDKLNEEIAELKHEIEHQNTPAIHEEYGDLLLVCALIGTYLDTNPEEDLRQACLKFINRFNQVEDELCNLEQSNINDMLQSWERSKSRE